MPHPRTSPRRRLALPLRRTVALLLTAILAAPLGPTWAGSQTSATEARSAASDSAEQAAPTEDATTEEPAAETPETPEMPEGLPEGDATAGEARYAENCVNCHGKEGKGMASFPAIRGQEAAYVAHRLVQYRAREKVGPNSALMFSLAEELTDEQIANLAAYIAESFAEGE